MNFIASPPPSWTSLSCRPRHAYQAAEIESRDGYARRARSSAAMRRYGSEPSSAVRASRASGRPSIAVRSEAGSEARRRTHASATSKAPSRQPRPRSTSSRASERSARAPERSPAASFASASVARMRGSYHSAARRLRASASARSSTLVAAVRSLSASSAAPRNAAASTRENTLPRSSASSTARRPWASAPADRKLCVGQHRAHLELEHCVGSFGELRSALRACEVLPHVAREPAQASVGREQERVACLVLKSLGDRARLVEEAPGLTLLDSGDAADFE